MSVLLEMSMFPTDHGESKSEYVSQVIKTIRESGYPYQLTPMATIIETDKMSPRDLKRKLARDIISIYYDDKQAGALLAENLISSGKSKGYASLFITGLSGDNSEISVNREKGLFTNLNEQIQLNQVVRTLWDPVKSQAIVPSILKRYPKTNVFWTASDEIALAVKHALSKGGYRKEMLIGGIGWTPKAINAIKNNELTASVGGHFMQGAWAVIKAFDHSQGYQAFSIQNSQPLLHQAINKDNINQYQMLANNPNWKQIDFTQFSLFLNKKITQYNFDLDLVISSL